MVDAFLPPTVLSAHRQRVRPALEDAGAVVLVPSGLPVPKPGTDQVLPFHAHPEYLWLAGGEAPRRVLVFDPRDGWVLFAHRTTEEEQVWEGPGETLPAVAAASGLANFRPIDELCAWLSERAGSTVAVLGNRDFVTAAGAYHESLSSVSVTPDETLSARVSAVVSRFRAVKDAEEIELMRRAARASAAGHQAAMRAARPGMTERELAAELEAEFFRNGPTRTAYPSIVGGGANGAILHSTPSARRFEAGDMVLVDAGAEYGGYASDVTRVFPVSETFSPEQRDIYSLVLAVQQAAIEKAVPGKEYKEIHLEGSLQIAEGLVDLGILSGDPASLVERDAHALFFPHGIGHMLGLATHDAGGYAEGRAPSDRFGLRYLRTDLPLAEGNVVTIEPGIYFIRALLTDPERHERYRDAVRWDRVDGMLDFGGIRIEDDVHVTAAGPDVLSAGAPKDVETVESFRRDER